VQARPRRQFRQKWLQRRLRRHKLDASKNSPIRFVSDSIGVSESELIACEVSEDFSMSMIA
jgi:hypothetical protein